MSSTLREHMGAFDFLSACWEENPALFGTMWTTAVAFSLVILTLSGLHQIALRKAPPSMQRSNYMSIAAFPLVYTAASLLTLLSPMSWRLCRVAMLITEAYVLVIFSSVLFSLLSHESAMLVASKSKSAESAEPLQQILTALAVDGPRKHFGVLPLGFCCSPCMSERDLTVYDLQIIRFLVRQYVLGAPVGAFIAFWLMIAFPEVQADQIATAFGWFKTLMMLMCVYGLVVLYKSSYNLLHEWRTTTKFISIKSLLIISAFQENVIEKALVPAFETQQNCFEPYESRYGSHGEVQGQYLVAWLLCLECVFLAFLLMTAFPASELMTQLQDVHIEQLDVAMSQHFWLESSEASGKEPTDAAIQNEVEAIGV